MNHYTEKMNYVQGLNFALAPLADFEAIKYARTHTGAEYIRISDTIGGCAFLDVTGVGCDGILDNVAQIVRHEVPKNIVTDISSKMKIAPEFY